MILRCRGFSYEVSVSRKREREDQQHSLMPDDDESGVDIFSVQEADSEDRHISHFGPECGASCRQGHGLRMGDER